MKCQACEEGRHHDCGMQTWCDCDCEGYDPQGYCEGEDESECGAGAGPNDIVAWQRCSLAGTEHCDFECHFARAVRRKLREMEDEKHERKT